MKWARPVTCTEEVAKAYEILLRNSQGKEPLGVLGRKWEENVKMNLTETECECVDWVQLDQNRVLQSVL